MAFAHLYKQQDPLIYIVGASLPNTDRIINLVVELLQRAINLG